MKSSEKRSEKPVQQQQQAQAVPMVRQQQGLNPDLCGPVMSAFAHSQAPQGKK